MGDLGIAEYHGPACGCDACLGKIPTECECKDLTTKVSPAVSVLLIQAQSLHLPRYVDHACSGAKNMQGQGDE